MVAIFSGYQRNVQTCPACYVWLDPAGCSKMVRIRCKILKSLGVLKDKIEHKIAVGRFKPVPVKHIETDSPRNSLLQLLHCQTEIIKDFRLLLHGQFIGHCP